MWPWVCSWGFSGTPSISELFLQPLGLLSLSPPEATRAQFAQMVSTPGQEQPLNSAFFPLWICVFSEMLAKFYMTL